MNGLLGDRHPLAQYQGLLAKLMESQGQPGTGILDQLSEAARIRRIKAIEAPGDQLIADMERFGGPVSDLRRSTLGGSDEEAVSNVLPAVMGSTWGGGVAGTVLDDPINALRNVFNPQRSQGLIPMVLGPTAKTAKAEALGLAKKMDKAGASREDIWRATADMGQPWFKGVDGKWKFEISDEFAAWKMPDGTKPITEIRERLNAPGRMSPLYQKDVVDHPALYDAYPEMENAFIKSAPSDTYGTGSFSPHAPGAPSPGAISIDGPVGGAGEIPLNSKYGQVYLDTDLHELQHAVQEREGFAKGGSVSGLERQYNDARARLNFLENEPGYKEAARKIDQAWDDAMNGKIADQEMIDIEAEVMKVHPEYAEARSVMQRLRELLPGKGKQNTSSGDFYGAYKRLAGEAEARAVQSRMGMTAAERAANPFWNSFDVPEPDQIVRQGYGGPAEMTTYHGSPHRINNVTPEHPQGRFDLQKIGTGEGAQAYGHGIYLAESPGVAKSYQVMGDGKDLVIRKGGKEIARGDAITDLDLEVSKLLDLGKRDAGQFPHNAAYYAKKRAGDNPALVARIDELKDASFNYEKNPGNLYTVDLPDEKIAKMLDWDAPLSEQPAAVREAMARVDQSFRFTPDDMTGGEWYKYIAGEADEFDSASAKELSDRLRRAGVPGIRYFDGSSRAAGEGTRNFVVFDPSIAKILKRE